MEFSLKPRPASQLFFWATVTSNGSPYATGPLSCLSCLPVCNVGVLWPNGWMDKDATWYGGIGLGPGDVVLVLDGDQATPTERCTTAPTFRDMSVVAKRSAISATAELLLSI